MQKREIIQQQINELHAKATARPTKDDPLGMVGFGATLLAAKIQAMLLQSNEQPEQDSQAENEEGEVNQ
jgi:hypothetical protein